MNEMIQLLQNKAGDGGADGGRDETRLAMS